MVIHVKNPVFGSKMLSKLFFGQKMAFGTVCSWEVINGWGSNHEWIWCVTTFA